MRKKVVSPLSMFNLINQVFSHQLHLQCPMHVYYKPLKTIFCYFHLNETTFQILVCLLDSLCHAVVRICATGFRLGFALL